MKDLSTPILFVATANAQRAREFYEGKLGLKFVSDEYPALVFRVGDSMLRIQKVERVRKSEYTSLGWDVKDIRKTVRELQGRGVEFQRYEGMNQDKDGIWISPSGGLVAWFKDPDGNILSLTQFKA
jgi:catechol 2,3-dioxygenase-like lactoylglutathione lyase family enzyme